MVGLMSLLLGEVIFEGVKFIIMLLLLVGAVIAGGKLKAASDARKASKAGGAEVSNTSASDDAQ